MTAKEVVDSVVDTHRLPPLDGKPWGLFEIIEHGDLGKMLEIAYPNISHTYSSPSLLLDLSDNFESG